MNMWSPILVCGPPIYGASYWYCVLSICKMSALNGHVVSPVGMWFSYLYVPAVGMCPPPLLVCVAPMCMMSALYGNVVSPFGMWSSYLYDVYPVGMWSLLLVCGARIYMITPHGWVPLWLWV